MNDVKDNDSPHVTGMRRGFFNDGDLLEFVAAEGEPADGDQHERYYIATTNGGTTRLCDGQHRDADQEDHADAEYVGVESLTLTNND